MKRVYLKDHINIKKVEAFLSKSKLSLDPYIQEIYAIYEDDQVVATGALYGKVLKCIAVSEAYKGKGLINTVMSFLMTRAYELGFTNLFIYTKPCSYHSFEYFGFRKIAQSENVILLENAMDGIEVYLDKLKKEKIARRHGDEEISIGALVMNCNPFTLGHQYLVEKAAASCSVLHLIIVEEEQSTFPFVIRERLVRDGTKHLDNVLIHSGGDYVISQATFPSYFMEGDEEIIKEHTQLDLDIFMKKIAVALDINHRFVGEEPFCKTTNRYNKMMSQLLEKAGIGLTIVPRLLAEGTPISASKVRCLLSLEDFDGVKKMVPKSTYDYLTSSEAQDVLKKIKKYYTKDKLV